MPDLPAVIDAVSRLGFPSAVAGFVLWRVEKTLRDILHEMHTGRESLTAALLQNTARMEQHMTTRSEFVVRELRAKLPCQYPFGQEGRS